MSFRVGGTFVGEDKFIENLGIKKPDFEYFKSTIIEPATNGNGQLNKEKKEKIQDAINFFLNQDIKIPDSYTIRINMKSLKSLESVSLCDIFLIIKGSESKVSFNDMIYFVTRFIEESESKKSMKLTYWYCDAIINSVENTAKITIC